MVDFISRKQEYRYPTGAVKSGQPVRFRLHVSEGVAVRQVHLVCKCDGGKEETFVMYDIGKGWYEISLAKEVPDLYFYRFEVVKEDGNFLFVGKGEDGRAVVGDWLPEWKWVVYDKDFSVADKWKGGVMYQIFPDRFHRVCDKAPDVRAPGKRYFHSDVREKPYDYTDPDRPGGKDYYGGSIEGVMEKLNYLKELGVTIIYFNPIFESAENHRYSTADYRNVDGYFGTNEQFVKLCRTAREMGIDIILDGVFSHTGADSVYFNKEGYYKTLGAYNSKQSPYYDWYQFESFPEKYKGWWGFKNLPNVNETSAGYLDFITGKDGVLSLWQERGAAGWRLDVADELPDEFLYALHRRVKENDPDSYIVGEVWEHAVEKISYGARRKFLLGGQCDSVMNYPWREAIIQLVKTGNVSNFCETVQTICEDYPRPALDGLMNILSTHDTCRILSELGAPNLPKKMQAEFVMSDEQRARALSRLRTAALIQFTLPGIPCIYYGDEVGMEGFADPYCRGYFDWQNGDGKLHDYYAALGKMRALYRDRFAGDFAFISCEGGVIRYRRGEDIEVVLNFSGAPIKVDLEKIVTSDEGEMLSVGAAGVYRL